MKNIAPQSIAGSIILTQNNNLCFVADMPLLPTDAVIALSATLQQHKKYVSYCRGVKILNGSAPRADLNTMKMLYEDFVQADFDMAVVSLLAENRIYTPEAEKINALSAECGNDPLNSSWLRKARRWLHMQAARVSFLTIGPRQIKT